MVSASAKQLISILLGPLACFLITRLPAPTGMEQEGMVNLGACVWIVIWWLTEAFPMTVTSVLMIPIFGFLGLMTPVRVYSYLGNGALLLIFGATILIGLLKESRFINRYAYWTLTRPFIRGSMSRLFFVFIVSVGLLSSIAPNVPLAILFVSITLNLGRSCQVPADDKLLRGLTVLSGTAPAIGGIGTPLGGAPNLVIIALIAKVLSHDVTFWEWSALGMPMAMISLVIMALIAAVFFHSPARHEILDGDFLKRKMSALGPVTRYEHIAMFMMGLALFLWIAGPSIAGMLGWKEGRMLLNGPSVAIIMGAATFLIPLRRNEKGKVEFAMNWKQAVNNISWDILIIAMGILAFGDVLLAGGVDKWMAALLQSILGDMSGLWVLFFLILFTGLASQVISNLALIALVIPMTSNLAAVYGFNALAACVSVGMAANVAIMFPFSSVAVASAYMGGAEYVRTRDFALYGLITSIVISVVVFCVSWLLGNAIFPV